MNSLDSLSLGHASLHKEKIPLPKIVFKKYLSQLYWLLLYPSHFTTTRVIDKDFCYSISLFHIGELQYIFKQLFILNHHVCLTYSLSSIIVVRFSAGSFS